MNGDENFPEVNYAIIVDGHTAAGDTLIVQAHGDAHKAAEECARRTGMTVRLFQEIASYTAETKVVMRKVGE
jgi:hypothetical protein